MNEMTPDQEARRQETERLLRAALHQHAQRIEPSPDAFFVVNQRIARKEERLKLPALLRVRLQPSMVVSIVLLIALSVVTTLLLTRDDNNAQPVDIAATPSSTVPEPPDETPVVQAPPPASDPEEPEAPGPQEEGPNGRSGQGSQNPQVVIGTDPAPSTVPAAAPPPVSASPPASTSTEPPTTAAPSTAPPPPPEPAYAIRPLQVASKGRVIVYEDHDTSSEHLGIIPVSLDEGAYLATGIRATDYDGNHWSEVRLPSGEIGWVELETVAITPLSLSEAQKNDLVAAGYHLLGVVAANESANESEDSDPAAPVYLSSTSLNASSRGVYVATIVGTGAVYNRFSPSQFLDAFGVEGAEERNPVIASLYSQLACLAGNAYVTFGDDSDIAAPVAMQVLPYVVVTGISADNTCTVLVYFDYLRGQAELIGFSVHS